MFVYGPVVTLGDRPGGFLKNAVFQIPTPQLLFLVSSFPTLFLFRQICLIAGYITRGISGPNRIARVRLRKLARRRSGRVDEYSVKRRRYFFEVRCDGSSY